MSEHALPEIILGRGPWQLRLKGVEAINAVGWALKVLVIARAIGIFFVSASVTYIALRIPETAGSWLSFIKALG
jgi:hypothetical protein